MCTKKKIFIIIGLLFTITLVVGIGLFVSNYYYWKAPSRSVYRISKTVPKQDIGYNNGSNQSLDFINADGTEKTQVHFPFNFRRPEISKDGNFIYGIDDRVLSRSVYWDINAHKVYACHPDQWGAYSQVVGMEDPDHPEYAFVDNTGRVLLLDIKKCEIIKIILDNVPGSINGISYNAVDKILLYGSRILQGQSDYKGKISPTTEYQIRKFDLATSENTQIAAGVNPSWSPDGSKISFTGTDGLFVMDADGTDQQIVISYPFEKYISNFSSYLHWSPDGKWFVYEYCEEPKTNPPTICDKTPIYIISSSGGSPIQIVDDGSFPFWMP